jgi:hypothetical protein
MICTYETHLRAFCKVQILWTTKTIRMAETACQAVEFAMGNWNRRMYFHRPHYLLDARDACDADAISGVGILRSDIRPEPKCHTDQLRCQLTRKRTHISCWASGSKHPRQTSERHTGLDHSKSIQTGYVMKFRTSPTELTKLRFSESK